MKRKWIVGVLCAIMLICQTSMAYAENTFESNYIYDYWGNAKKSLPAFEYMDVIDTSKTDGIKITSVDDVCYADGRIFTVDATESRVNVFDNTGKFITSIKLIRDKAGKIVVDAASNKQMMLTNPEGIYYDENTDLIYIADTVAERVVVLDGKDYTFVRSITKPENLIGATQFKPSKLIVNREEKIDIVVQGSYEGIVELEKDGSFSRYFGVNKPKVNLLDYFWKSLATDAQKEKMKKTFAPSFCNIDIDSDGMLYAVTFDPSAQNKVFRFNAKGENVLAEDGYFPVTGDLDEQHFSEEDQIPKTSNFVDIAVSDYGVYAVIDKTEGRVFVYDFEGDLLNVFGKSGNLKGDVKNPTAIEWMEDKLLITDKQLGCCYIYKPTEFGKVSLKASENYFFGKWDDAGDKFRESLELNSNYDLAYVGVGRNYLMDDDFDNAKYYLKLGNNREYYSKAYNGYRNIVISENFIWFALVFLLLIFALFYSEYKYNRKND